MVGKLEVRLCEKEVAWGSFGSPPTIEASDCRETAGTSSLWKEPHHVVRGHVHATR